MAWSSPSSLSRPVLVLGPALVRVVVLVPVVVHVLVLVLRDVGRHVGPTMRRSGGAVVLRDLRGHCRLGRFDGMLRGSGDPRHQRRLQLGTRGLRLEAGGQLGCGLLEGTGLARRLGILGEELLDPGPLLGVQGVQGPGARQITILLVHDVTPRLSRRTIIPSRIRVLAVPTGMSRRLATSRWL